MLDAMAELDKEVQRQKRTEEALTRIAAAKARMILNKDPRFAFFVCLLMRLKVKVAWDIETMATDGRCLYLNPEFTMGLAHDPDPSKSELVGVLVHEVMHCSNAHFARVGNRHMELANIAMDLAINPFIVECGLKLPKIVCLPGEGGFKHLPKGLNFEHYYSLLLKDCKKILEDAKGSGFGQVTKGQGNGQGDDEDDKEGGGSGGSGQMDEAEMAKVEAEWKVATSQAASAAKTRGKLPACIERYAEEAAQPKVNWKDQLRDFVTKFAKSDYSWSRPNRRYISQGLYLPGLHGEEIGDLVIAVDTSGSINQEMLAAFAGELNGITEAYACKMTIIYCDAAVNRVDVVDGMGEPIKLKAVGGGGTSHRPVFEYVAKMDEPPVCVVCLTDLYTDFPKKHPDVPCLWAVYGGNKTPPPFGRVIQVE